MDLLQPHAPHIDEGDLSDKEDPSSRQITVEPEDQESSGFEDWLQRAQDAFRFSTRWVDSNYRKRWEDSLRAFNNQHSLDSKYNNPSYDKRSKVYRPKMRSVIRKNEAAAAAAYFSNLDVVDINAQNQSDPKQLISAEIMKMILQYRLTNSEKGIPWFLIVLGGLQDAQKTGAVCARYEWEFDALQTMQGPVIRADRPMVKLIPVENIRLDPAADWYDPINTSPYVIEIMPMYVGEVREMAKKVDQKTNKAKWFGVTDGQIRQAISSTPSSTQIVRERGGMDPYQPDGRINDYEVVFVQRHIHRVEGLDWEWFTLSDVSMLSQPKLLAESIFTGKRNYVLGCCVLETHTALAPSVPELGKGIQEEINEVANQRLDNVKFVLNKRWLVARNKNVDTGSLVRNVPGGITMMDNPKEDIVESNWPDVTGSSYQEQDRLNADIDELLGNFSSSSVLQNRQAMETPMRTLGMLNSGASMLTEYLLRTYTETFIEPLLRGIVQLEQKYETDTTIITMAAQKSQMLQRYGMDQVTDEILNQELTIKVNVGMGATDPNAKLQKFAVGLNTYVGAAKNAPPGMNINEIGKEIFGLLGYQDGRRFLNTDDPQKQQMLKMLQMAFQQVQQLEKKIGDKHEANVVKLVTSLEKNKTDKQIKAVELANDHDKEQLKASAANDKMQADMFKASIQGLQQLVMQTQQQQGEFARQQAEHRNQAEMAKTEGGKKEEAQKKEIGQLAKQIESIGKRLEQMTTNASKPKKTRFKINRGKDGKAESVDFLQ